MGNLPLLQPRFGFVVISDRWDNEKGANERLKRAAAMAALADYPPYPLQKLWQMGLPLTICTDNPGISKTTLTGEYLLASRLVGGITLWDALAIIKQAFSHSFLPADEREVLMKSADNTIFKLVAREFS
ncbi:MAG: hypothetical protein JXR80_09725 [Deltaproteobacteria bacterium]|nr:hypothetical protein [Deltaproteobacteria bacterium]